MNKKAFTLVELMLVVALVSILAFSSIPYLMGSFGGFNKITSQEQIVNSLQEVSTVITRKIVFDKITPDEATLNQIISDLKSNNGISVSLESVTELRDKNNNARRGYSIILVATKGEDTHKLRFLVS